ncbi:unnamed protein product [Coffea canephora]|uniref:Glycoside hydrolase family 31 N-terminal domain-containing protein n=1 Tax=Coffea canephora TaxID=49390 RepID=A0A068UG55_COFCA|nr:unnamed protein product [Coffea canephora]
MAGSEGTAVTGDMRSGNMIFEPILEDGVFRFDCSTNDRNAAFPSVSFVNPVDRETPTFNGHRVPSYIPTFECVLGQQIVNIEFPHGTSFYGTGEVFTWNTIAWGYGPGTTSLYQSHPWVLAVLRNGGAIGVLADTTRRCEIDLRKELNMKFIAQTSYPIITFGPFSSPTDVLISLSHAIGTVFMPPKWSLGYHQCRWSYASDARVREIARTFREKNIPCDVIWMDIDYMDGFCCFTFDRASPPSLLVTMDEFTVYYLHSFMEQFPDPKCLVDDLHQNGFKAIWMLDPGIKLEKGYFVYYSGSEKDIWVQTADGKPFVGEVWPGPCVFPDFTQSKARSWWANLVRDFACNGVDGIWNDMNEPNVFQSVTKTMPENNIHRGDDELGGCQIHSHYHNRTMLQSLNCFNDRRPFVLTRAGFVGSQRYAVTWTGDNLSTWEHLHLSISMVLQLMSFLLVMVSNNLVCWRFSINLSFFQMALLHFGLSGQPFSGPDIGGFGGNATPKLFRRWMGVGSLFPFCRGHFEDDTNDHEPWSFGEECEEVCHLALKRKLFIMLKVCFSYISLIYLYK